MCSCGDSVLFHRVPLGEDHDSGCLRDGCGCPAYARPGEGEEE